jgi:hypothetical protein
MGIGHRVRSQESEARIKVSVFRFQLLYLPSLTPLDLVLGIWDLCRRP